MGFGRLLLISLIVLSISSLLSYFITPDIINLIYTTKYQFYGKPELGYFISILESLLQGLKDIRVTIIIVSTSLLDGVIYFNKKSWIAGVSTYTILLILLLIFYYRLFNAFNIPDTLIFLANILFTITIVGLASSIPGIIVYIREKKSKKPVQITEYSETSIICLECGVKYDSKPLICVKCGLKLKQATNIDMETEENCTI